MFGIGMTELIVILAIVLLLFGAKRLPEVARALGRAIKEFNKASSADDGNVKPDSKKDN